MQRLSLGGQSQKQGFTIVELLIVVVVIAILAAITVVGFTGVQNSAHDSAVKADLRQYAIKVQEHYVKNNTFPVGSAASLGSLGVTPSKESYGTHYLSGGTYYNLLYCYNSATGNFAFIANSKSGKSFAFSDGRVTETAALAGSATSCPAHNVAGFTNFWLYGHAGANNWISWV